MLNDDGEPVPPERLELWKRDPVECVKELMGNPMFKDSLEYAPQKHFVDKEGKNHVFDEMWTGDWWWIVLESPVKSGFSAPKALTGL